MVYRYIYSSCRHYCLDSICLLVMTMPFAPPQVKQLFLSIQSFPNGGFIIGFPRLFDQEQSDPQGCWKLGMSVLDIDTISIYFMYQLYISLHPYCQPQWFFKCCQTIEPTRFNCGYCTYILIHVYKYMLNTCEYMLNT
jgi:hypothetical protein